MTTTTSATPGTTTGTTSTSRPAGASRLDTGPTSARLIGALFLVGFLCYGTGFALVTSVTSEPDFLRTLPARPGVLTLGVFLMLLNTVVDIGKGVLFFPVLARHGRRTALVYLSALVAQVVLMDVGALFLLMLVPLGRVAADAGPAGAAWAPGIATVLTDANTTAYDVAQATLCLGGVFLSLLLLRTGLVPRALAVLGVAGYVLHAVGSSAELFGLSLGSALLVPGALFEVGLALWLLVKGFRPASSEAVPEDAAAQALARGTVLLPGTA